VKTPDQPLYSPEGLLTAALIENPKVYGEIRWVDPDIFEWQQVRAVYVAAEWVLDKHPDCDSHELIARVKNVLIEYEKADALTVLVRMLGANIAIGLEASRYARELWTKWQHHNLQSAVTRMQQIVRSDLDLDVQVDLIEQTWVDTLADAHAEPGWRPIEGLSTVGEFMDGDETHEWVIPGLLERQERFMLVAPEKSGKSVLTRQVALLLAAGRHPFNVAEQIPPMTTLMVDLENPAPVARRDFRRQVSHMDGLFTADNNRAFLWHKPAGIHLGDKADRLLLRNVVDRIQPSLLCVCPVYKAFDGLDRSWEEQAHGVQKPLDRLREDYNCAIWLEHHAPWGESGKREVRPIGSSRWVRWLDYTVSLVGKGRPPYNELEWQSVQRDERKIAPKKLRRGILGEPAWVPIWDDDRDGFGFSLAMHAAEE
jgi:AAA domain